MRTSTPSSLRLRPGAARQKKSAQKGGRRKGEIEFTEESSPLILINRIMRA
jgi:hypothetical protein